MIVSGYTLHLYCDFENDDGHRYPNDEREEFFDELKSVAWMLARRGGWKFVTVDGVKMAKCPRCAKAGIKVVRNGGKGY